ncbi:MAG TPA: TonB-dependent receptor plug domain-containing protein, partial [Hyphomicrobiales bacterium]|nr:TonB-dependent receptor plug domain-containing protein [Hyphomicrobiales bacterium]
MLGGHKPRVRRFPFLYATAAVLSLAAAPALLLAQADATVQEQRFALQIPTQALADALKALSLASRSQILAPSTTVAGRTSKALSGSYTVQEALEAMVQDTGLIVTQSGNNTFTLALPPTDARLLPSPMEEIIIRGSYTVTSMNSATGLNMTLRETPQSVSILTSQIVEDFAITDMSSVLQYVPGVSMVGDASEDSLIYVRGFNMDASIQVDGMITTTANSGYSGSTSQGIDPVIAERVEVLKGAAGILSGLGEPSATVNMIRKRPTDDFRAMAMTRAGNWDTYRVEGDVSGRLNQSGSVRGRLVGAYQDNKSFHDRYGREKNVLYGIV